MTTYPLNKSKLETEGDEGPWAVDTEHDTVDTSRDDPTVKEEPVLRL